MKRFLSYALCATAVCLASCSQDETLERTTKPSDFISFNASLPEDAMQTRADAGVKRYIMQVYNGTDNVDLAPADDQTVSITNANGDFQINGASLGLEQGVTYTAVFWADYDATDVAKENTVYNTDYLSWVYLNDGKQMTMAYCGKLTFTYGEGKTDLDVTLKRAVAQVNLKQKTAYTANDDDKITVSYTGHKTYNVLTPGVADDATNAFTFDIAVEAGEKAEGSTLGSFVAFASNPTEIKFKYNDGEEISVANVPLKENYQTNISGNYGSANIDYNFSVTTDDAWGGANENIDADSDTPETGDDGEGGQDEPTTDTVAPTITSASITTDGLTVNYEITVADETTLAGGWLEIKLSDSNWQQVGEGETRQYRWVDFGDDAGTIQNVTGSFTAPSAGTYRVEYKVCDSVNEDSHQAYENKEVIVTE